MGILQIGEVEDIISFYVKQHINHKLAADLFKKLEGGKTINPGENLVSFIYDVNQEESFTKNLMNGAKNPEHIHANNKIYIMVMYV